MSNMSSPKFSEAELRLSIADILIESISFVVEKEEGESDENIEWLVDSMLNSMGLAISGQNSDGHIEATLKLGTPLNIFL